MMKRYSVEIVTHDAVASDEFHAILCDSGEPSNVFVWTEETDTTMYVYRLHGAILNERQEYSLDVCLSRNVSLVESFTRKGRTF